MASDRWPNDDKRRVLEATDLVRLIGEHVSLKRKGREWGCLCPFHDDHNPSMYVVPHKQIYHCFVCGAGGDAITFVMNYHKMGFREALQLLADKAGITLTPLPRRVGGGLAGGESIADDDDANVPGVSREALLAANGFAQGFFRAILNHPEHGTNARALLAKRGLTDAIVEQFGLGASPDRWDGLALTIASKQQDLGAFISAGLLKTRDQGNGHYDALRNRLTFPIHDVLGRVIAFGGRRLNDADEPKYLNSPETMLFSKSATLYGLPFASAAIREQNVVIVTEGYMDCIACHQAGVKNVVATLGTALTAAGARVLRRLCDTIVLLFDGDDAGQRAADRAIEVLFAEPVDVKIATMSKAQAAAVAAGLPKPKDPDELLKQPGGVERFQTVVTSAEDALEYRFARLSTRLAGMGFAARTRAIEDEITRVSELGLDRLSPVRRRMIARRIASVAGVQESVVLEAAARAATRRPREQPAAETPRSTQFLSQYPIEDQLIAGLLVDPSALAAFTPDELARIKSGCTEGLPSRMVIDAIIAAGPGAEFKDVLLRLDDPAAIAHATALSERCAREIDQAALQSSRAWQDRLAFWRDKHAAEQTIVDPIAIIERARVLNRQAGERGIPRPLLPKP